MALNTFYSLLSLHRIHDQINKSKSCSVVNVNYITLLMKSAPSEFANHQTSIISNFSLVLQKDMTNITSLLEK